MSDRRGITAYILPWLCLGFLVASPANAGSISYTYDALGRLVTVTDPTGVVTAYTYDAAGNRTQVNISGGTTNKTVFILVGTSTWTVPTDYQALVKIEAIGAGGPVPALGGGGGAYASISSVSLSPG